MKSKDVACTDQVCLIIDIEGLHLADGRFQCRELGYCSWLGDVGRVAFNPLKRFSRLNPKEEKRWRFVYREIHGLSYRPHPEKEEVVFNPRTFIKHLFWEFATEQRTHIAFKGGNIEKSYLVDLHIPYLNLEDYGCPKYDFLRTIMPPEEELNEGCGQHAIPNKHHCAMEECQAFMRWYKDFMNHV